MVFTTRLKEVESRRDRVLCISPIAEGHIHIFEPAMMTSCVPQKEDNVSTPPARELYKDFCGPHGGHIYARPNSPSSARLVFEYVTES